LHARPEGPAPPHRPHPQRRGAAHRPRERGRDPHRGAERCRGPAPRRAGAHAVVIALGDAPLPAAVVDLDAFDGNVDRFVAAARAGGKRLRVATKSLRVPALLARARDRAGDTFAGLMTYSAAETAFLAGQGWRDLLLAYPTARPGDAAHLAAANAGGAVAAVVVDDAEQLAPLAAAARAAATTLPVVVDIDVSYRRLGMHLGVRRSPLHDPAAVVALAERAAATAGLRFHGVMGYEAQIAGLPERLPFTLLKRVSAPDVAALRARCVA